MNIPPPIPPSATIAEAIASIRTWKTVDELRTEKAQLREASSRDDQAAKRAVAGRPMNVDDIAAAMPKATKAQKATPADGSGVIERYAHKLMPTSEL